MLPNGYYALVEQSALGQADRTASFAARANRVAVRTRRGRIIAAIEIVSPGNKNSRHAIHSFVEKASELLGQGVHLLVIDLFPPSPRDPKGIHKLIWDEIHEEEFQLPADKPLTLAAYVAGVPLKAYVEPVAVGDELTAMPLFLDPHTYIPAPLQPSYDRTWERCPQAFREQIGKGS